MAQAIATEHLAPYVEPLHLTDQPSPEVAADGRDVDALLEMTLFRYVPVSLEDARETMAFLKTEREKLDAPSGYQGESVSPSVEMLRKVTGEGIRLWQLTKHDVKSWKAVLEAENFAEIPKNIALTTDSRLESADSLTDNEKLAGLKAQAAQRIELDKKIRAPKSTPVEVTTTTPMDGEIAHTIRQGASGMVSMQQANQGPRHRAEGVSTFAAIRTGMWRTGLKYTFLALKGAGDTARKTHDYVEDSLSVTNETDANSPRRERFARLRKFGGKLATAKRVVIDSTLRGLELEGYALSPDYEFAETADRKTDDSTNREERLVQLKHLGGQVVSHLVAIDRTIKAEGRGLREKIVDKSYEGLLWSRENVAKSAQHSREYLKNRKNQRRVLGVIALGATLVTGYLTYKTGHMHLPGSGNLMRDAEERLRVDLPTQPKTPVAHDLNAVLQGVGISPEHVAPVIPTAVTHAPALLAHAPVQHHADFFTLHHGQTIWGHEAYAHPRMSDAQIHDHVAHILHRNHWSWEDATKLPDNTKVKLPAKG